MLMAPGDVLVFHSLLLHRSTDNVAQSRRSAMVYHYAEAGARPTVALAPIQERILNFTPVMRNGAPVSAMSASGNRA